MEIGSIASVILLLTILFLNCYGTQCAKCPPCPFRHGIYMCTNPRFASCATLRGQPVLREVSLFDCSVKLIKIDWKNNNGLIMRDRFQKICTETETTTETTTTTTTKETTPITSTLPKKQDSQKKKENHYLDDELKGFTLALPLNFGLSICIFIGLLILIKDKFKKLKCGTKISKKKFKRNRAIFNPRHGKLPSRSEIELYRMQSYMSASDENDYDSVIFDRESV